MDINRCILSLIRTITPTGTVGATVTPTTTPSTGTTETVTQPVQPTTTGTTDTTKVVYPIIPPTTTGTSNQYGVYNINWGNVPTVNNLQGLNPGYITNVPTYYTRTNPAQSQYYWGQHPFQPTQPILGQPSPFY